VKKLLVVSLVLLSGCVDLSRVGMHPAMKETELKGNPPEVVGCLFSAALGQRLRLERDDPLSADIERYNLTTRNGDKVAWIEVSAAPRKRSNVSFYYAKEASAAVSAMIAQCEDARF